MMACYTPHAEQGNVPPQPQHSLTLVRALGTGHYTVSIENEETRGKGHTNLTTFIVRVEAIGSFHYFPLVNIISLYIL